MPPINKHLSQDGVDKRAASHNKWVFECRDFIRRASESSLFDYICEYESKINTGNISAAAKEYLLRREYVPKDDWHFV